VSSMSTVNQQDDMVSLRTVQPARRFLGWSAGTQALDDIPENVWVFEMMRQPDGAQEFRELSSPGRRIRQQPTERTQVCLVRANAVPVSPVFSKTLCDEDGHHWDCRMQVHVSVSDARSLLTKVAINYLGVDTPFSAEMLGSWIEQRVAPMLVRHARQYSIDELRNDHAIPLDWWEKELNKQLRDYGLEIRLTEISWESAQAEAAQEEAAKRAELERIEQATRRQQEASIRQLAMKAEYEQKREAIEADRSLSQEERRHKMQLLEKQHRLQVLEADEEIANAQRQAELAAAQHKAAIAKIRNEVQSISEATDFKKSVDEKYDRMMAEIEECKQVLEKLADLPGDMLAQLNDRDAENANAAAERLISPEFDLPAHVLKSLGFRVERQNLVAFLRQKWAADGELVNLEKYELTTRDIGTGKINVLQVESVLAFEFTTERSGYVTLINKGTSGAVYVHIPNAYITADEAKVNGGGRHRIPGDRLIPERDLDQNGLQYREMGPPGWEHLAIIVSDTPLVSDDMTRNASPRNPFIKLTSSEITELCDVLNDAPSESWTAGVLSFLVE